MNEMYNIICTYLYIDIGTCFYIFLDKPIYIYIAVYVQIIIM